jgi:hypothetical protein
VEDAARLLERAYRRFEELRATLTRERLNTVLTLRRRGRTATLPPWAMLRHIVNHSTYHRSQVAAKLKRFGIEQPATDFFFSVIEQIPQGGINRNRVRHGIRPPVVKNAAGTATSYQVRSCRTISPRKNLTPKGTACMASMCGQPS